MCAGQQVDFCSRPSHQGDIEVVERPARLELHQDGLHLGQTMPAGGGATAGLISLSLADHHSCRWRNLVVRTSSHCELTWLLCLVATEELLV